MKKNRVSGYSAAGLAVIGVCMAAGCVTTDTVSSRFPQLEENITAAIDAEAGVYAPAPLKMAETKLEGAKAAMTAKDMLTANRLVDEAMVDADYARAVAPTEKSRIEAKKLRDEIQVVRAEINKLPTVK